MNWEEYKEQNIEVILPAIKEIIMIEQLDKRNRTRHVVQKKYYLMWWLRQNTAFTLTRIASFFNVDHSTVIHGVKYHNDSIDIKDKTYLKNTKGVKEFIEFKSIPHST